MSAETSFNRASYIRLPNIMLGKPKPKRKVQTVRKEYYKVFLPGRVDPIRIYDKQELPRIKAKHPDCVIRLVSPQN